MDAYVQEFDALGVQIPNHSAIQLLNYFLIGLKLEIRYHVRFFRLTKMSCSIELAQDVELRLARGLPLAFGVSYPSSSHTEKEIIASISVAVEDELKEDSSKDILKEDSGNKHVAHTSEIYNESKKDIVFPMEGLTKDANMPHISSIKIFGSSISMVGATMSMTVNAVKIAKFGNVCVSKHLGTQLTMHFVNNDGHTTQRGEPSMQMKLWDLNMFTRRPPPMPPDMNTWKLVVLVLHSVYH